MGRAGSADTKDVRGFVLNSLQEGIYDLVGSTSVFLSEIGKISSTIEASFVPKQISGSDACEVRFRKSGNHAYDYWLYSDGNAEKLSHHEGHSVHTYMGKL